MKKNHKSVVAVLLCIAMVLSLTACGQSKPTATPSAAPSVTPSATPASTPTPTPTPTPTQSPTPTGSGKKTYPDVIIHTNQALTKDQFELLSGGSGTTCEIVDLSFSENTTITNTSFSGTVKFGAINAAGKTVTIDTPNATVELNGAVTATSITVNASNNTTKVNANIGGNLVVGRGNVVINSGALSGALEIPTTNTTITTVQINGGSIGEVTIPAAAKVTKLEIAGSAAVAVANVAKSMEIKLSGSAQVDVQATAPISIKLEGSADLTLKTTQPATIEHESTQPLKIDKASSGTLAVKPASTAAKIDFTGTGDLGTVAGKISIQSTAATVTVSDYIAPTVESGDLATIASSVKTIKERRLVEGTDIFLWFDDDSGFASNMVVPSTADGLSDDGNLYGFGKRAFSQSDISSTNPIPAGKFPNSIPFFVKDAFPTDAQPTGFTLYHNGVAVADWTFTAASDFASSDWDSLIDRKVVGENTVWAFKLPIYYATQTMGVWSMKDMPTRMIEYTFSDRTERVYLDYSLAGLSIAPPADPTQVTVTTLAELKEATINNTYTSITLDANLTLDADLTITSGKALTIASGKTLTVGSGKTLTINGTLVKTGTLTNNGTVACAVLSATALTEAIGYNKANIKLSADIVATDVVSIGSGKDISLDLNGYTVKRNLNGVSCDATNGCVFGVDGGKFTVSDSSSSRTGKVIAEDANCYAAVCVNSGEFILNGGTLDSDYAGVYVNGDTVKSLMTMNGGTVNGAEFAFIVRGDRTPTHSSAKTAKLNIKDGTITSEATDKWTIFVEGKGAELVIEEGRVSGIIGGNGIVDASKNMGGTAITISGGTFVSEDSNLYLPQEGTVNISGGTFTSGAECVSMKDGRLTISGGTFTANGAYFDPASTNDNGAEPTGACISITSNDCYHTEGADGEVPMQVAISGGSFTSRNGHAIYEGIAYSGNVPAAAAPLIGSFTITGGTFASAVGKDDIKSVSGIITGNARLRYTRSSVASSVVGATEVFEELANTANSAFELYGDLVIPVGTTVTVGSGKTLTVKPNASITVNGTLVNNGTIEVIDEASLQVAMNANVAAGNNAGTVKLLNNIAISDSWQVVGAASVRANDDFIAVGDTTNKPFKGVLDGNNFMITNMTKNLIDKAFGVYEEFAVGSKTYYKLGTSGKYTEIKNITFETAAAGVNARAIAVYQGAFLKFTDVTTNGKVQASSGGNQAAGIIWAAQDVQFIDCTNNADLVVSGAPSSTLIAGGLVAQISSMCNDVSANPVLFKNCVNTGDITASGWGTSYTWLGQLFGNTYYNFDHSGPLFNVRIEDCATLSGTVTVSGDTAGRSNDYSYASGTASARSYNVLSGNKSEDDIVIFGRVHQSITLTVVSGADTKTSAEGELDWD